MPAPQSAQVEAAVAAEHLPASQLEQTLKPVPDTYLPAGHPEQVAADADVAPPCPYSPTEQGVPEHVDETEAPTTFEYVPGAHLVQTAEPAAAENVPAVQLMQAEAPVDSMYVPAVHNEQVAADADVAPVCPYVPGEQSVPEQAVTPPSA